MFYRIFESMVYNSGRPYNFPFETFTIGFWNQDYKNDLIKQVKGGMHHYFVCCGRIYVILALFAP